MFFKHSPSPICLVFLIFICVLPGRGHAQLNFLNVDAGTDWRTLHEDTENTSLTAVFKKTMYEADRWRHEFNLAVTQIAMGNETATESILLNEKTSYSLGEDVYAFSALRHDRENFSEYRSSIAAGVGWRLLDAGSHRLDLDMGAAKTGKLQESGAKRDLGARLGLQFTSQLTPGSLLRQDLVIESSRSHTTTESMTTWSYAMNRKLALEVLFAVRKSSSLPADSLDVQRRALLSLNYAF